MILLKLIVGLGNPGKEYENTRHNVGFMVIDSFFGENDFQKKFDGLVKIVSIGKEKVLVLKPQTFMNLSGNSIIKAVKYYDIALDDLLVIQDDMDLDFGTFKIKKNSSSGGHNGIKSIIGALGSENFARLKIGISHDIHHDTIHYVLGKFSKSELQLLEKNMVELHKIIETFINKSVDAAMQLANSR